MRIRRKITEVTSFRIGDKDLFPHKTKVVDHRRGRRSMHFKTAERLQIMFSRSSRF